MSIYRCDLPNTRLGEYMQRSLKIGMFLVMMIPITSRAVDLYDDFPSEIHPNERYVIYSHNLIVEGDNPTPVHAEFGISDFPAVKQALFKGGDFNLIAHHRPKNTEIGPYVERLESWVQRLLAGGVQPSRITLIGFSRGSQLTAYASSRLRSTGINTVLLAACTDGDIAHSPPLILGGNFLSIYETTDVVGSCAKLAARSHVTSFKELAISTGKKHGAFFLPRSEWVRPLKAWIEETNR
jgi:hypothetical protein